MFGFLHRLLGDCILNLLLPGKVPVTANTEKEDSQHVNSPESIGEEMTAGLTVPLLKARCKELGLPVSGRKADLISRIEAHVQVPKARQTDSDPSDTPQKRKEATTENPKPKKKSKNIIEASATRLGGEQFDCVQVTSRIVDEDQVDAMPIVLTLSVWKDDGKVSTVKILIYFVLPTLRFSQIPDQPHIRHSYSRAKQFNTTNPRIAYERIELENHQVLSTYALYNSARLKLLPDPTPFQAILPPAHLLEPSWDRDYRNFANGENAKRGTQGYVRPAGWIRFALKVRGKYENDKWLGVAGPRETASPDEWFVTYHGTAYTSAASIAAKGYNTGTVWSTTSIQVTHGYSGKGYFIDSNRMPWRVVMQNRVHPSYAMAQGGGIFTVHQQYIRPYAILVQPVQVNHYGQYY